MVSEEEKLGGEKEKGKEKRQAATGNQALLKTPRVC